jgi:hypothetical protein
MLWVLLVEVGVDSTEKYSDNALDYLPVPKGDLGDYGDG